LFLLETDSGYPKDTVFEIVVVSVTHEWELLKNRVFIQSKVPWYMLVFFQVSPDSRLNNIFLIHRFFCRS